MARRGLLRHHRGVSQHPRRDAHNGGMDRVRRRWLAVALLLIAAAGGVAWLSFYLSRRDFDWVARFSEIASFILAAVGLLPLVAGKIAQWVPAPRIKDEQVDSDANALAAALRARGRYVEVLYGANVYDRLPMPVRWVPAPDVPGTDTRLLQAGAVASGDDLTGTFDDVLDFFRRLPEPRLMVLGEAGAGKTVLAAELARRLLASRRSDGPVPVVVPVMAWDPAKTTLFDWIAEQLVRIYSDLAQVVSDGHQALTRAQVLVDRMRVLPILDGLDEVAETSRPLATLAINRYGWSQPLVVTCRSETYMEIAGQEGGTPVARAAVIKLLPLTTTDIEDYLGPDPDGRWAATFRRLDAEPGGALTQVLANPLMLWLAWTIYRQPGGVPDELADRDRFGSTEAIEHHLLTEFVPALYPDAMRIPEGPVWRRQATRVHAERWLGFLASDSPLHRRPPSPRRGEPLDSFETRDIQNIAWWRLTDAAGGLRIFGVLIRGALLGVVLWQLVQTILHDNGNWRDGTYVGHLPFRKVFLDGPLGRFAWPTIYRLLQQVPAKTRNHAFVVINHALRDVLSLPAHHLFFVFLLALPAAGFFVSAPASRPYRVLLRPVVLLRWLTTTVQGTLLIAFLMWIVLIYWHHAGTVSSFFSSRSTWLTILVLSLAVDVPEWSARLVSPIDVVGATRPEQSLHADKLADIFVTMSRRALRTAALALLCGSRLALLYLVYAVSSATIGVVLGGQNGWASRAYTDACFWLAIRFRLPWRPMRFLADADRRGIFQEVGAIYRFRHNRVQLELGDWYELNRFRLREWQPRLLRLLEQHFPSPEPPRLRREADSYRTLTAKDPARFGERLTAVLSNLADAAHDLGRPAEELQVRAEIVATRRRIAATDPGMQPRLAVALEQFARCLTDSGRQYEALGLMSEAAGIYGRLETPQRREFQSRLADWLDLFSSQADPRAQSPSLTTEINRVTDAYRDLVLAEPEPDDPAHARALRHLAKALQRLGRNGEAATVLASAAKEYRNLIRTAAGARAAGSARDIASYAQALARVVAASEQLKQPGHAVDARADAVERQRELARADPSSYLLRLSERLTRAVDSPRQTASQELNEHGSQRRAEAGHTGATTPSASAHPGHSGGFPLSALNDLSVRLWKLGERDAALDVARVGHRLAADGAANPPPAKLMVWAPVSDDEPPPQPSIRASALTGAEPTDTNAFLFGFDAQSWTGLADMSDTRALRLLISGRARESREASASAVSYGEQAVADHRRLAETSPSHYLDGLAGALDLLAGYLRKAGSREPEAEEAAREAQEIRRLLGLSR